MARRIDIEKKRPSRWPWLVGIVALGLVGWGTTVLLAPPERLPEPEPASTASDTLPPAAIPSPPGPSVPAAADPGIASIEAVSPIGEEDLGDTVMARGEVVATGNGAFWIVVGSEVVQVESRRAARKGDTVSIRGILEASGGETTGRIDSEVLTRSPRYESWTVVPDVKLVESGGEDGPTTADTDPGTSAASR